MPEFNVITLTLTHIVLLSPSQYQKTGDGECVPTMSYAKGKLLADWLEAGNSPTMFPVFPVSRMTAADILLARRYELL